MKILVACEESQRVCKAFRKRGHEAYSCDIVFCSWVNQRSEVTSSCIEANVQSEQAASVYIVKLRLRQCGKVIVIK